MDPTKPGGNAVAALILGIVSILLMPLAGPFAVWLGLSERKAIREGRSSPAGDGMALAGVITGIVGCVFLLGACACGLFYVLLVVGVVTAGGIAAGQIANAMDSPPVVLRRIHTAQMLFLAEDLDRDGAKDYARSLDELEATGAFQDGADLPQAAGYRLVIEGGAEGYTARMTSTRSRRGPSYFIDQTGVLRSNQGGDPAGPDSPVAEDIIDPLDPDLLLPAEIEPDDEGK